MIRKMAKTLDILIPTYARPAALAVTMTGLVSQTYKDFRLVVSDQTPDYEVANAAEVRAVAAVLRSHGHPVEIHHHLPSQGMAEQRQFLLDQTQGDYALYLDDDLILEPYLIKNMMETILKQGCGFGGSSVIGLSYLGDIRPNEQAIEFWEGQVKPEAVLPNTAQWNRFRLHSAANIYHVAENLGLDPLHPLPYKVAWVGACVLFNIKKLRSVGGFNFWNKLPPKHSGEDVVAQLRVMSRYGGCGIIPSGVYHQELPTTVTDRRVDAPYVLDLDLLLKEP